MTETLEEMPGDRSVCLTWTAQVTFQATVPAARIRGLINAINPPTSSEYDLQVLHERMPGPALRAFLADLETPSTQLAIYHRDVFDAAVLPPGPAPAPGWAPHPTIEHLIRVTNPAAFDAQLEAALTFGRCEVTIAHGSTADRGGRLSVFWNATWWFFRDHPRDYPHGVAHLVAMSLPDGTNRAPAEGPVRHPIDHYRLPRRLGERVVALIDLAGPADTFTSTAVVSTGDPAGHTL